MNYFFIFGNHPDISFLELTAKLQSEQYSFSLVVYIKNICILTLEKELPLLFTRSLGGTIKYGVCLKNQSSISTLSTDIIRYLKNLLQDGKRLTFGLSVYTRKVPLHRLGIQIKK